MFQKRWFLYLAAYFFWVVALALALWLLLSIRNVLPFAVSSALVSNPVQAERINIIIDRVLVLGGGIGWLVLMTILEQYFRKGAGLGRLWMRAARVLGVLLLVLGLVDALQLFLSGLPAAGGLVILLTLVELAAGAALVYLARRR